MQPHIDATKNGIASVAESLKNCYAGVDLRIAFVGYTDFDMHTEQARVTLFHFNRDLRPFIRALAKIEADGGGDAPEDIFGGLDFALNKLKWGSVQNTNLLIHIADSPCHGTAYHNWGKRHDDYPNGDPTGITLSELMSRVVKLRIQYKFGWITKSTDKMIKKFNEQLQIEDPQHPPIESFYAFEEPTALAKEVTEAAISSVTASLTAAHVRLTSTRHYRIVPEFPQNWDDFPLLVANVQTFSLLSWTKSLASTESSRSRKPRCV